MRRSTCARVFALLVCGALFVAGLSGAASGAAKPSKPTGEPIKIGLLGLFSGIGGPVHIPKQQTYEAWAEMVNANGGINGHPVEVIAKDHGGNQAAAVSMAKDMVENEGVVALATTGSVEGGVVQYAQTVGVPVVGVGAGPAEQATNPFMFQTAPAGTQAAANLASQVKAAGYKKVATMYCVEAPGCKTSNDANVAALKDAKVNVVYQGGISLGAGEYTAECLAAKDAGATIIIPVTSNLTPPQIAASCNRQNYKPAFVLGSASDEQAAVAGLDGSISVQGTFPWFLRKGSPAIVEYANALKKYAPDLLTKGTSDVSAAWTAAKVFQKAAETGISAKATPSPELVLDGLYAMKDYDVDGLMPNCMARTYVEGSPTPATNGSFLAQIKSGKWGAPDGAVPLCSTTKAKS